MLTALIDLQRAALRPWLALGHDCARRLDPSGLVEAALEHACLNLAAGDVRPDDLAAQVAADLNQPLEAELLAEQPFLRLFAMRRRGDRPKRRLLLISPYSGYATRVLSPLIAGLVPGHEVILTDWRDARLVPAAHGPFDLEAQVLLVEHLIRTSPRPLDVIGLSQSTVPLLAAVARIAAADPGLAPRTMTLLGGPIVPGANGLHDLWLTAWNDLLDLQAFRRVPAPWPGAGREVYPSLHQLLLIVVSHPDVYVGLQAHTLLELASGRRGDFARGLENLHAVIDTPAELVRQMIREVFRTGNLALGRMMVAGRRVDPAAISRTALLTVEAGRDALVGKGDTHRAAALVNGHPALHRQVTLPGASHPDLFTGPVAGLRVAPLIRAFLARAP